eukprot:scaffold124572_cov27-Tisochrysis_lutea.AAC.5
MSGAHCIATAGDIGASDERLDAARCNDGLGMGICLVREGCNNAPCMNQNLITSVHRRGSEALIALLTGRR